MSVIRTFSTQIEAEMAQSALEAAGIESMIVGDDCGGVQPAMGLTAGIQVIVDDDLLEAATEVLDASTTVMELPADQDVEPDK
jgi:hypothetical protein